MNNNAQTYMKKNAQTNCITSFVRRRVGKKTNTIKIIEYTKKK